MTRTPLIICDFDGTVTMNDNIVSMMKEFAPPEWLELKEETQKIKIEKDDFTTEKTSKLRHTILIREKTCLIQLALLPLLLLMVTFPP